ncbi:hypothetical protein CkaCkLH20_10663 [Colletotrichum karsti]|uniref:Acetylornithine deacetylase n=1 Tax=Colletotrichum karsti TaxID=1095194 RepID=A0A9P6HWE5_9PEZI|nr:uncharacterized protein CkaCkLH20_10663 [Colletotrichum karsti]KAF9871729.1 hypothetical protein CkaCkLH20_10663 [Colletotrichum karsti]
MTPPEIDEKKCLDFLSKLVQIKSYSQSNGEIEITDYIHAQMTRIGLESAIYPFDEGKRQNAVGIWKGTGQSKSTAKTLLFNGHLDTNPVSAGWTVDPWEGKVDEGFIYGIGVSNMKSGCAAYFCAVETLKAAGWTPSADVTLTYVVGELQGGVGTKALIDQGRIAADYFINCEPSDIRSITMHAESLVFEIQLLGVTRHMSAREEAADAILAACELIPILSKMRFRNARTEEHAKCNRCNVGVVHGALGKDLIEWRPPQVADYAKILGSARYAPGQSRASVISDICDVVEGVVRKYPGMSFEFKEDSRPTMPAFEVSKTSPIVKAVSKAYHDVRNEPQAVGVLSPTCFYGSDSGFLYKMLGMEGVVCGPGGRYNTRPDEKVDIADYLDCVRMFIRVIMEICG